MSSLPPRVTSPRHWLRGPTYSVRRDPLRWIPNWFKDYGDIYRIASPLGQATVVGAPELARQVLVDRYPRYQQKSQAYSVLRILMGNGLVTSEGEFSMFSSDVRGAAADVSGPIATLNEYALRMLRRPWLFLLPRRFPTPFNHAQYRALRSLNEIVHGIIRARRRQPAVHDDLLTMLLTACEEGTGRGMTDEQLRDEVMTIFVAGHETTANAMAWLLYLVSQHSEVEEQLLAEIDAQWPGNGLTPENLGAFSYTCQVIEESLRVYPTIWSIGRRCTEEDELGGHRIPPGMNVVVPIFHFHWSERFWSAPEKFDPSRFSPERRPPPEAMVYFPFGAGPRSCIGNHFALQELMIMTVVFHRHFQFRLQPGFAVEPDPLITLRPKHGMAMVIRPRREFLPSVESKTQSSDLATR